MENLVKLVNATSDPEPELNMIPPEFENDRFAQNPESITHLLLMKKPKNNKCLKQKLSAK